MILWLSVPTMETNGLKERWTNQKDQEVIKFKLILMIVRRHIDYLPKTGEAIVQKSLSNLIELLEDEMFQPYGFTETPKHNNYN